MVLRQGWAYCMPDQESDHLKPKGSQELQAAGSKALQAARPAAAPAVAAVAAVACCRNDASCRSSSTCSTTDRSSYSANASLPSDPAGLGHCADNQAACWLQHGPVQCTAAGTTVS